MRYHVLVLAVLILCLPACVTKSKQATLSQAAYMRGYNAADQECIELQLKIRDVVVNIQQDINAKNTRLRAFNQLNSDNSLRPITKEYDKPKHFDPKPITKRDTWMK